MQSHLGGREFHSARAERELEAVGRVLAVGEERREGYSEALLGAIRHVESLLVRRPNAKPL